MAFKKREKEDQKRIHVFVATPAYDGKVTTDYSQSLAESVRDATLYGIRCTASVMGNGAFIDLARNIFVRMFLETECTHLFFIDSDLKWESRAFLSLLAAGKPVCAGAYRKRQEPEEYPLRWVADENGHITMNGDWIMCDRVATGFLCIERSVLEEMVKTAKIIRGQVHNGKKEEDNPRLFYTYLQDDGKFVGEDFAWCKDYCDQTGDQIWVWPDFDFVHNKHVGNYHDFLCKQAEEQIAKGATGESSNSQAA